MTTHCKECNNIPTSLYKWNGKSYCNMCYYKIFQKEFKKFRNNFIEIRFGEYIEELKK